ncbi:MAG TPA: DUF6116 family protein [Xanthomonadales bacterium]|nr:DUF6116 family protein [Xanthomonadales bacterium]
MNPVKKILSYAESLRFPWLVLLTAAVFIGDLLIPDVIPFVDELLLGLLLAGLGRIRKPKTVPNPAKPGDAGQKP